MRICDDELVKIDYVNGELGPLRRILYARHLAQCPSCRDAVEELAEIASAVRETPQPQVSAALVAETMRALASIRPAITPAPRRIGWFLEAWERPRILAAGALAVAGMVALVITHLNGHLTALLATASIPDVWALLSGLSSQPDATGGMPIGVVLMIAALVAVPSLIDSALGLAMHRAVVRSCALGSNGSAGALGRRV